MALYPKIGRLKEENETLHAENQRLVYALETERAELARLQAENERLRFILLRDWPHCVTGDTDGEAYAELLHDAGLIEWCEVIEPCDGDGCCCEPGDQCQRLTVIGRAALARDE